MPSEESASEEAAATAKSRVTLRTLLLPGREKLPSSTLRSLSARPLGRKPEVIEEPPFRAYVRQAQPVVMLLELNSVATFNMMDPTLGLEVNRAMDSIQMQFRKTQSNASVPMALLIQGSGPHFCPGGNPAPIIPAGATPFFVHMFNAYLPFVRCRELQIPTICSSHGSQVGGGVAYALNCTMRVAPSTTTVAFGNLSRGAVPGMFLSQTITSKLGLSAAMTSYLTDSTWSAYAALENSFFDRVYPSREVARSSSFLMAKQLAASSASAAFGKISPSLDMGRFAAETVGITLGAKTGEMFSKFKQVGIKPLAPSESEETPTKDDVAGKKESQVTPVPIEVPEHFNRLGQGILVWPLDEAGWTGPTGEPLLDLATWRLQRVEATGHKGGSVSPEALTDLDDAFSLACAFRLDGKYFEAEPLFEQTLEGYSRLLGEGHLCALQAANSFGLILHETGHSETAEGYLRRAVAGHRRQVGPLSTQTLSCVNNLALCLVKLEKHTEGIPMLRQALAGMERARGPNHPGTLIVVLNLAACLKETDQAAEAETMTRRALVGLERALGPDHPSTLLCCTNLGAIVQESGRLAEAEEFFRRSLGGLMKTLGIGSPNTMINVKNLVKLYTTQGRTAEASQMKQLAGTAQVIIP